MANFVKDEARQTFVLASSAYMRAIASQRETRRTTDEAYLSQQLTPCAMLGFMIGVVEKPGGEEAKWCTPAGNEPLLNFHQSQVVQPQVPHQPREKRPAHYRGVKPP